jgi:hypothetical protein
MDNFGKVLFELKRPAEAPLPTTKKTLESWLASNKRREILAQDHKSNGVVVHVRDEHGAVSKHSIAWR